tara:strand:+ start:225 stop:623 length:399 start_codon:yes stop_codon:yes gene_type:complete
MRLRGRKIIEPKVFQKWWRRTSNNANAERSDEIFKMVKNLTWVRMPAGREFDPRGLHGEINKGRMVDESVCDPDYQYYYYANDGKDKLYLLWPSLGSSPWSIHSYGSSGWSLGINPLENKLFLFAINKQNYP